MSQTSKESSPAVKMMNISTTFMYANKKLQMSELDSALMKTKSAKKAKTLHTTCTFISKFEIL